MSENPYRLARDIRGIGFKTADAIAMRLGIVGAVGKIADYRTRGLRRQRSGASATADTLKPVRPKMLYRIGQVRADRNLPRRDGVVDVAVQHSAIRAERVR